MVRELMNSDCTSPAIFREYRLVEAKKKII